jgi:hypothetical protein
MDKSARDVAIGLALLLISGCAASTTGSGPQPTTAVTASASTAEPSRPTPALTNAAPAQLVGNWVTTLDSGDKLTLTLGSKSYRLTRGANSGSGHISVQGDEIEFSGSNLCDGTGTYHWSIDGDDLTFTAFGPTDPCGGTRVLDRQVYVRIP